MKNEEIFKICNALINIANFECCDYGFTEEVDAAEEFVSEIKSMTKEQNYIHGYKNGKSDVLDKIRVEIAEQASCNGFFNDGIERALEIIDKYAGVW